MEKLDLHESKARMDRCVGADRQVRIGRNEV